MTSQARLEEEVRLRDDLREQLGTSERRGNALSGELEESRTLLEQADRSRRQVRQGGTGTGRGRRGGKGWGSRSGKGTGRRRGTGKGSRSIMKREAGLKRLGTRTFLTGTGLMCW